MGPRDPFRMAAIEKSLTIDALQKAEQKAMLDKLFVETVDQEII